MTKWRTRRTVRSPRATDTGVVPTSGLDRLSCAWRDAVGPGYVVGVTQDIAATLSVLDSAAYCR
jgi:hypothetical protein